MNYTQAQIDRANAVSLEDFLRTQGETLIKSGREYRWKEHDSLTVRASSSRQISCKSPTFRITAMCFSCMLRYF